MARTDWVDGEFLYAADVNSIGAEINDLKAGGGGAATWDALTGKPAVVAAGATEAEARTVIGFRDGVKEHRSIADLRDWDAVRAANWKTFLGLKFTAGSTSVTGTPWTADDVGKIAMILVNRTTMTWWKTAIVDVGASGAATVSTAAPAAGSDENTGARVRYGFDGTTAINTALAEVNATTDGPVEVHLGGNYRLTQLIIPANVILHGVPWKPTTVQQLANSSKTILAQLPGAEKDFVIFDDNPQAAGTIGFCGLTDLELRGPELNVVGMPAATKGNGVAFRINGSDHGLVIDGFQLRNVSTYNFPESGFKCYGAVPFYVENCKALHNGLYGFEYNRYGGSSCNGLHFMNFSADWNNLGAIGLRKLAATDTVFITGTKSEGHVAGDEANSTRGGPNFQSNAIVFEDCDQTPVSINGLSHIRVARAGIAPGPAIQIQDTQGQGRRPILAYNAVLTRLTGTETGSTTDAVTIGDAVAGVSVPRTVVSGYYPTLEQPTVNAPKVTGGTFTGPALASPKITGDILDGNGNKLLGMVGVANAVNYMIAVNGAAGGFTSIQLAGPDPDIGFTLYTKGNGIATLRGTSSVAFQAVPVTNGVNYLRCTAAAAGSSPQLAATGADPNVDLVLAPKSNGKVRIGSNPVSVKVGVPDNATAAGQPGYWAADASFIYVYTGDGTTHSWVRATAATW